MAKMVSNNTKTDTDSSNQPDGRSIVEASLNNDYELVSSIMEKFPDSVNEQNEFGLSALMAATGRGHLRIVLLLTSSPKITLDLVDCDGNSVFDYSYSHPEILAHLMNVRFRGVNILKPEII